MSSLIKMFQQVEYFYIYKDDFFFNVGCVFRNQCSETEYRLKILHPRLGQGRYRDKIFQLGIEYARYWDGIWLEKSSRIITLSVTTAKAHTRYGEERFAFQVKTSAQIFFIFRRKGNIIWDRQLGTRFFEFLSSKCLDYAKRTIVCYFGHGQLYFFSM